MSVRDSVRDEIKLTPAEQDEIRERWMARYGRVDLSSESVGPVSAHPSRRRAI